MGGEGTGGAARSVYDGAVGLNNKMYLMGGSSGETKATYVYLPSSDSGYGYQI